MLIAASYMHNYIQPIIGGMGLLASLVCAFLITWAGLIYITSSGNPQNLARAKRMITRALIGLVIVIAATTLSLFLNHTYSASVTTPIHQLPVLNSIRPASSSGGLVDVILKAISGLLVAIIQAASSPFMNALQYFTKATPLLASNSSVMHLWLATTAIADSLLVLVIALLGFHVMSAEAFGLRDANLKTMLPQVLLVFVLINTSIYLLDGIIELSNALITAVRLTTGNISPWHSLLGIITNLSGYSLVALLIFVIFLVFSVILLIYYIARIVVLYLGAILAPVVVLLWLIPGSRDFVENALKTYIATIFVLFIHVVILALAASLFSSVATVNGIRDPIMSLMLGLATLVTLIKTQGVLMQLNYASIGPKTARRLGGSLINGAVYIGSAARSTFVDSRTPISSPGTAIKNTSREAQTKYARYEPSIKNNLDFKS